jgi:hypothetical protein
VRVGSLSKPQANDDESAPQAELILT